MAFILLIAFIAVPIIEISVFIKVGGLIGLWPTIGIVILTAVIGTAMLRQQGLSVLFRIQQNFQNMPIQKRRQVILGGAAVVAVWYCFEMGLIGV